MQKKQNQKKKKQQQQQQQQNKTWIKIGEWIRPIDEKEESLKNFRNVSKKLALSTDYRCIILFIIIIYTCKCLKFYAICSMCLYQFW